MARHGNEGVPPADTVGDRQRQFPGEVPAAEALRPHVDNADVSAPRVDANGNNPAGGAVPLNPI
jgi:hypothetical protein